jgi:polyisoprenyl-phosphate glycosyltransferase
LAEQPPLLRLFCSGRHWDRVDIPIRWDRLMLLSVIVPVHNEGEPLGVLLGSLNDVLLRYAPGGFEVIIVDDGSNAETKRALANLPVGFRVITLAARRGSGAARRLASDQARGLLCAWIDGDSTYDPEDLVLLASRIGKADQVIGCRRTDHGGCLWLRYLIKRLLCALVSAIWMTRIPDLNSGLRVFRREAMRRWLYEVPAGFSCTSTATLAALNRDQRVGFIPISYRPRPSRTRSKFHPIYDTGRLLRVIARQARIRWVGRPEETLPPSSITSPPAPPPVC